jgi:hypothetical protein
MTFASVIFFLWPGDTLSKSSIGSFTSRAEDNLFILSWSTDDSSKELDSVSLTLPDR